MYGYQNATVCTVIFFTKVSTMYGYLGMYVYFFPSVSTMYDYSGMYDYCFFPNSPLCTVIRVCTYIRNLIVVASLPRLCMGQITEPKHRHMA